MLELNSGLAGFLQSNDLKTEVEILQSPSVLMPIFQYSQTLKMIIKKGKLFRLEEKIKD